MTAPDLVHRPVAKLHALELAINAPGVVDNMLREQKRAAKGAQGILWVLSAMWHMTDFDAHERVELGAIVLDRVHPVPEAFGGTGGKFEVGLVPPG